MNLIKFNNNPANFGQAIDDFFNKSIGEFIGSDFVSNIPAVNVVETAKSFQLDLAAPGKEKVDFNINVEKNNLTISSEKKVEEEKVKDQYNRREFSYEAFSRSFSLPENVDKNAISASYENGVLKVIIPKIEEQIISKAIEIN